MKRTSAATTTRTASACGWPAAAIKGGCIHGATDEFGHKAVSDIVNHYDYHATLLHLFGLSGEQLSMVRPAGTNSLLDGQPGEIVAKILKNPPT